VALAYVSDWHVPVVSPVEFLAALKDKADGRNN